MSLKDQDHNLIDKYLRGQLNAKEKELFDEKQKDADFQKELTWKENSLPVFKKSGRTELKKKLQLLDQKMEAERSVAPPAKVVSLNRSLWVGIAAAVILLMGMFWWWNNQSSSSENLFAQYYEPYPNVVAPIVKSNTTELTEAEQGFQAYEKRNYEQAISLLEKNNTPEGKFYLGLAQLAKGNPDQATTILKAITQQTSHRFYQPAQWYLTLVYIQTQQVESANELLQAIQQNPDHPFYKKAEQIVEIE